jgi:SDR family mycofactocin-dependent oxidoreductase
MGKLDGKVAFITGAARGQGRSHSVTLAREGARIAAVDMGDHKLDYPKYPTATQADLDETVRQVEAAGSRAIGLVADVRKEDQMKAAVDATMAAFGRIDVLVANAGIVAAFGASWQETRQEFEGVVAVNLIGVWVTAKSVIPHMISAKSGSIILTSSLAGMKGMNGGGYTCAKWGVRGMSKGFANELAQFGIRCNSIHPGTVDTPMIAAIAETLGLPHEEALKNFAAGHLLPAVLDPCDISAGVLWLASDDSRYVTGTELCIDAGWAAR